MATKNRMEWGGGGALTSLCYVHQALRRFLLDSCEDYGNGKEEGLHHVEEVPYASTKKQKEKNTLEHTWDILTIRVAA